MFAWLLRRHSCKSNIISRSCALGILIHTKWQRVAFCLSPPHPAIFELLFPALFSPVSRTSPAHYSPGHPPPVLPHVNDAVLMLISRNLCSKSSEASIKTWSTLASLSFKGQATKHTTAMQCNGVSSFLTRSVDFIWCDVIITCFQIGLLYRQKINAIF